MIGLPVLQPYGEDWADELGYLRSSHIVHYLLVQRRCEFVVAHVVADYIVQAFIDVLVLQAMLVVHLIALAVLIWQDVLERVEPLDVLLFHFESHLVIGVSRLV